MLKICAVTILINLSGVDWTDQDMRSKRTAQKTCKKTYKSCLKKFIKKEPRVYNAICGE